MLDQILRVVAMSQFIWTSLQSASRFLQSKAEMESLLDGPFILPPNNNNNNSESLPLWEISEAFREGVLLDLEGDQYRSTRLVVNRNKDGTILSDPLTTTTATNSDNHENYEIMLKATTTATRTDQQQQQDDDFDDTLFVIRAYATDKFAKLRSLFGITPDSFRKSLYDNRPYVSFQTNSKGAARTGAIFFFTRDGAYLMKTIKREEAVTLLRMLDKYCEFMQENGHCSLLTRFCGLYDICYQNQCRTFVCMNSVFPARVKLQERFDLKGSTVGRKCSDQERIEKGSNAVLKDLDLMQEKENDSLLQGFVLDNQLKWSFLQQIERDVAFLEQCAVIDYSLLVGVEFQTSSGKKPASLIQRIYTKRRRRRVNGGNLAFLPGQRHGQPVLYYMGLIDFLQPYNSIKVAEFKLKSLLYDKYSFSCVPPQVYSRRLVAFLDEFIN